MKTEKISCDVCMDLIPLVRDNVASEDSKNLVQEHISGCERCRHQMGEGIEFSLNEVNDKKIIQRIRRAFFTTGVILLIAGILLGVALSNSMGVFYNFLIMPVVGMLGYLLLKKRCLFVTLGIFTVSYVGILVMNVIECGFDLYILYSPLIIAAIYAFLSLIGTAIALLLTFAFKKD